MKGARVAAADSIGGTRGRTCVITLALRPPARYGADTYSTDFSSSACSRHHRHHHPPTPRQPRLRADTARQALTATLSVLMTRTRPVEPRGSSAASAGVISSASRRITLIQPQAEGTARACEPASTASITCAQKPREGRGGRGRSSPHLSGCTAFITASAHSGAEAVGTAY